MSIILSSITWLYFRYIVSNRSFIGALVAINTKDIDGSLTELFGKVFYKLVNDDKLL